MVLIKFGCSGVEEEKKAIWGGDSKVQLHSTGGGRKFERPNVERLIFRNLKITGERQNFEQ